MNWEQVCASPHLQDLPFKIEANRYGQVVMSPATNWHGRYQSSISVLMYELTGVRERIFIECVIDTSEGTKVADVAWGSLEFLAAHKHEASYSKAPEICVEVISPPNSEAEMAEKRRLYFEQGAQEVWICDDAGTMFFFAPAGQLSQSQLIPEFPLSIEI